MCTFKATVFKRQFLVQYSLARFLLQGNVVVGIQTLFSLDSVARWLIYIVKNKVKMIVDGVYS